MSKFATLLATKLPAGLELPAALLRAWDWMEGQGWGLETSNGYYLVPYAGTAMQGVAFAAEASLNGWFEPGEPGFDRLLPFVELDGSGGVGVLWLDDDDQVRVAGLGSEGQVGLLAENALEFLRLVAIGYDEVGDFLTEEPEDEESVEAHAAFRAWVQTELGVQVPAHWQYADPDPFGAWVARMKGEEYSPFS